MTNPCNKQGKNGRRKGAEAAPFRRPLCRIKAMRFLTGGRFSAQEAVWRNGLTERG